MHDTTLFPDWSEEKQRFAYVIIDIIKAKHKEDQDLQLANITFGIKGLDAIDGFKNIDRFKNNIGIPNLQEIAEIQGKPDENWPVTAQRMLDLFCSIGEIKEYVDGIYRLRKEGAFIQAFSTKFVRT